MTRCEVVADSRLADSSSVRFPQERVSGSGRSRSLHRPSFGLIEHCPSGRIPFRTLQDRSHREGVVRAVGTAGLDLGARLSRLFRVRLAPTGRVGL